MTNRDDPQPPPPPADASVHPRPGASDQEALRPREVGGVQGPEPTRYGDWEHNGRCTDF